MDSQSDYPMPGLGAPTAEPGPVRVLVVDDSAYIRFTLGKYLAEAPGLSVVGAARDGREALELIPKLQPDVITMDVEMPRCDGLTALREIMARHPKPVIMLSSLTTEGANETIQALTWGAVDFVTKPTAKANVAAIMDEVIVKIHTAAQARVAPLLRPLASTRESTPDDSGARPTRVSRPFTKRDSVVVIGASTGGPRALNTLIPTLSAEIPAAVLIVQHMPAGFTHSLAERLNGIASLAVKEAEAGDLLEIGRALLAPGGYHMTVDEMGRVALNRSPAVHGVRPAVDVTMASVAQRFGAASVGVVLTGMGRDGTNGAALIHSTGGKVIAESESSCVVWGMPRSVAEAGVADSVLPLSDIGPAIEHAVRK